MIVVKVELHSARTGQITRLGTAVIANDGTGTQSIGNYDATFYKRGQLPEEHARAFKHARVEGHPRLRSSVWELVKRVIEASTK